MRFAIGLVIVMLGVLACALDLGRRIANRRRYGGFVNAIWGPDDAPVLFYVGIGLLLAGSFVALGTVNP